MSVRVLFLYNQDWTKELADYGRGTVPSHRLFGLSEVQQLGVNAKLCATPKVPVPLKKLLLRPMWWRIYQALYAWFMGTRFNCIVATHEAAALPVLVLKKLHLLKTPVVILNVALLHPKNTQPRRIWLWRLLLSRCEAIGCYAVAQQDLISRQFCVDRRRVFFIPLGIDTEFFATKLQADAKDLSYRAIDLGIEHCLSVGSNDGKDYPTLLDAMPPGRKLVIVTDGHNEQIVRRHLSGMDNPPSVQILRDLPIISLRELYRRTSLLIIPLREGAFSSGQTVLLENMAIGNTVIVTDTIATRDYVTDRSTALTVRSGDVIELRNLIESFFAQPDQYASVGVSAAADVRLRFSARLMARKLIELVNEIRLRDSATVDFCSHPLY